MQTSPGCPQTAEIGSNNRQGRVPVPTNTPERYKNVDFIASFQTYQSLRKILANHLTSQAIVGGLMWA